MLNDKPGLRKPLRLLGRTVLIASLLVGFAGSIAAQSVGADSVTANGSPPRWLSSSCTATIPELSDGSVSNPGICLLGPVDPDYQLTFTFSPANAQFMTGLNIWANDGRNLSDNELRQLDVEVDYFDPQTNSVQTFMIDDATIGDTTNFNTPMFVSFAGSPGGSLYRVSEVRLDNFVGRTATQQATFREVQGVFATLPVAPEIAISSSEAGGDISDGGTDPQGLEVSGVAKTVTYTITNTGTDVLDLSGASSVTNETNIASTVSVGTPGALTLAPGASTTLDVTYTPAADGPFGFEFAIPNNDSDEDHYDIAVSGTANEVPTVTLSSVPAPPTGPFPVTATFSEPVTGMAQSDFDVTNGVASGFSNPSPGVYTVLLSPIDPFRPVSVQVPSGIANDIEGAPNLASMSLTFIVVAAPTPTDLVAVEEIIIEETLRDLRSGMEFNQRAVRNARSRHAGYLQCAGSGEEFEEDFEDTLGQSACSAVRGLSIEPTFDGKFSATGKSVAGSGAFLMQKSNLDGTRRRLAFGEFSLNRYDDGDVTASLSGRIAWERLVGEDTLRGLFVGANATRSDIEDDFSGTRTGFGVNAGAYFVDQLDTNLFWDGFISLGVGQNDLVIGDGNLDVEGDYQTSSIQFGLAVSGVREFEQFDLHPELSLAYGVTSVGDADIISRSMLATTTDVVSVGRVALGVVRFRPEFVFAGEADRFGIVRQSFSVAPSLLCEAVRTDVTDTDCGGGLELEWSSFSKDGRREFSARAKREIIGGSTRDQLSVLYERPF